jgi:hypothetical protein
VVVESNNEGECGNSFFRVLIVPMGDLTPVVLVLEIVNYVIYGQGYLLLSTYETHSVF